MVRVKDLDASLHFYCDLLGLQEVRRTENEAGRFTLIFLAAMQASCSIPFVLQAVPRIAGAPSGAYWDGGITDYHMHLHYRCPQNAIKTIAASAMDTGAEGQKDPEFIDPFHGRRDLQAKVLRHVTEAFREDPVRILRVARFAARFHDFSIAPETMALMQDMVADGEVDHIAAQREFLEFL